MDARQVFLIEHARLHAGEVSGLDEPSLFDSARERLTMEQLRARPAGLNSIAWITWHMTRFEDVVVNTIIRGLPEVLDHEGWLARLGVGDRLVGTGSGDDEVSDLSARMDLPALLAYRAAVGRATRAWAATADFAALDAVADVAGRLDTAPMALDERAAWVRALWQGRSAHWLLTLPVIGHGHLHLGEARVTRGLIERGA
jgi:DinB superfamily